MPRITSFSQQSLAGLGIAREVQVLRNNDFSQGTDYWYPNTSGLSTLEDSNGSLVIGDVTNNFRSVRNSFQTVPGEEYTLDVTLSNIAGANTFFTIEDSTRTTSNRLLDENVLTADGTYSTTFTALSTISEVKIQFQADNATLTIDSISIKGPRPLRELVYNPTFDLDVASLPGGWSSTSATVDVTNNNFSIIADNGNVQQEIFTEPGVTYDYSFDIVEFTGTPTLVTFDILNTAWSGQSSASVVTNNNLQNLSPPTTVSGSFTAVDGPGHVMRVAITGTGGVEGIVLDNFSVKEARPRYDSIELSAASYDEGDTVTVTVSTSNVPAGRTVGYTISSSSAAGLRDDFSKTSGTVTIGADGTGTDTFTILEDRQTEGEETLTVTLDARDAGTLVTNGLSDTATINDTSLDPTYTIALDAASYDEGDTVTVNLTTARVLEGTTIDYAITSSSDAGLREDFSKTTGTFTVGADGTASDTFTIEEDRQTEGTETLTVTLAATDSEGNSSTSAGSTASDTATINDTSIGPEFTIALDAASYDEGDTVTVNLTTARTVEGTTVGYTITSSDGSGDFSKTSGTFTIGADGTASDTFTITEDRTTEGEETLTVTLDSLDSEGNTTGAGTDTATINDTSLSPTFDVALDAASYDEGDTVTITVTTTDVSNGTTVDYTITSDNMLNSEFSKTSGTITIGVDGTGTDTFTIGTDTLFELGESFTVTLAATDSAGFSTSSPSDSATVVDTSPTLVFENPNLYGFASDNFGGRGGIDVSDNYFIVGQYNELAPGGETNSGVAYIFSRSNNQVLYNLTNPDPDGTPTTDYFGYSVAINDTYAAVAAPFEDSDGNSSGRVYIYDLSDGSLTQTLSSPDDPIPSFASFGIYLKFEGSLLAVGQQGGIGKVFLYDTTDWSLSQTFTNPDPDGSGGGDGFGSSFDLSGNRIIIGASGEEQTTPAAVNNVGKAYVFNITTGTLIYTLAVADTTSTGTSDRFGSAVVIDGDTAVVGAYGAGGDVVGYMHVYDMTDGSLTSTIRNPNPNADGSNDQFAIRLSMDGDLVLTSSVSEDVGGSGSGRAYLYNVSTVPATYVDIPNPNVFGTANADSFGNELALRGGLALISASGEDSDGEGQTGRVYGINLGSFSTEDFEPATNVGEALRQTFTVPATVGATVNGYMSFDTEGANRLNNPGLGKHFAISAQNGNVYIYSLKDGLVNTITGTGYVCPSLGWHGVSDTLYVGESDQTPVSGVAPVTLRIYDDPLNASTNTQVTISTNDADYQVDCANSPGIRISPGSTPAFIAAAAGGDSNPGAWFYHLDEARTLDSGFWNNNQSLLDIGITDTYILGGGPFDEPGGESASDNRGRVFSILTADTDFATDTVIATDNVTSAYHETSGESLGTHIQIRPMDYNWFIAGGDSGLYRVWFDNSGANAGALSRFSDTPGTVDDSRLIQGINPWLDENSVQQFDNSTATIQGTAASPEVFAVWWRGTQSGAQRDIIQVWTWNGPHVKHTHIFDTPDTVEQIILSEHALAVAGTFDGTANQIRLYY